MRSENKVVLWNFKTDTEIRSPARTMVRLAMNSLLIITNYLTAPGGDFNELQWRVDYV